MFLSHFRYLPHFILSALKLAFLSSEGEKRSVLHRVWGWEGRKEDDDVASPYVGYLEGFQSGPVLTVPCRDRTRSAGLVQSHGSGMRSPASLSILGAMFMAEPGMEDNFRSKGILCTEVTSLEMSLPLGLHYKLHASLKVFFLIF